MVNRDYQAYNDLMNEATDPEDKAWLEEQGKEIADKKAAYDLLDETTDPEDIAYLREQLGEESNDNAGDTGDAVRDASVEQQDSNQNSEPTSAETDTIPYSSEHREYHWEAKNKKSIFDHPAIKAARYIAPRAARFATNAAIKGTLIGAGAVTGIAAGLVSDKYSNVATWGLAGGGAGLLAGKGIDGLTGSASDLGDRMVAAAEREYEATHTDDEIRARRNKIEDAKFLRDKEAIKKYSDELNVSQKRAKEIMKEDVIKYREYGVTDDDIIIKAMKAKDDQFGSDKASKERILLAKMAEQVGGSRKELENVEKSLHKRGMSKEDIAKFSNGVRDINKWV